MGVVGTARVVDAGVIRKNADEVIKEIGDIIEARLYATAVSKLGRNIEEIGGQAIALGALFKIALAQLPEQLYDMVDEESTKLLREIISKMPNGAQLLDAAGKPATTPKGA